MYIRSYFIVYQTFYCAHREVFWFQKNARSRQWWQNVFCLCFVLTPHYSAVLAAFFTTKFCFRDSPLFASLTSWSLWDRAKLIAPLSFAQAAMEGFPIIPVWSCVLSIFLPTIPRFSPCKSLRGRSKAKQQEIDHRGFLRHSFKYWCT